MAIFVRDHVRGNYIIRDCELEEWAEQLARKYSLCHEEWAKVPPPGVPAGE